MNIVTSLNPNFITILIIFNFFNRQRESTSIYIFVYVCLQNEDFSASKSLCWVEKKKTR